jgi:hypothetical protein
MKKTTLVLLSIASMAGFVGVANAIPVQGNNAGYTEAQLAQGGAGGSNVSTAAQNVGASNVTQYAQNGLTTNTLQTVPEPGSLLLLGIGLLAVAIWQRRLLSKWAA